MFDFLFGCVIIFRALDDYQCGVSKSSSNKNFSNVGWRVANTLNKQRYRLNSFEPPTAPHHGGLFFIKHMGVKMTKLQKLEKMFNSNADFPPGYFLHAARICTGLSRGMLASKMGISVVMLTNYEQGKSKIPPRIMLQIFLFGLDFYRRASGIKE